MSLFEAFANADGDPKRTAYEVEDSASETEKFPAAHGVKQVSMEQKGTLQPHGSNKVCQTASETTEFLSNELAPAPEDSATPQISLSPDDLEFEFHTVEGNDSEAIPVHNELQQSLKSRSKLRTEPRRKKTAETFRSSLLAQNTNGREENWKSLLVPAISESSEDILITPKMFDRGTTEEKQLQNKQNFRNSVMEAQNNSQIQKMLVRIRESAKSGQAEVSIFAKGQWHCSAKSML